MGRSVLVCGSRTFTNWQLMCSVMDENNTAFKVGGPISRVIHGGAAGADRMAGRWSKRERIEVVEVLPEWGKYGISAGYKRNVVMLDMLVKQNWDEVIAFWDGKSRGTKHTIATSNEMGFETTVILFNPGGSEAEAWHKPKQQLTLGLGDKR